MLSHSTIRTIAIALPAILFLILLWIVPKYFLPNVDRRLIIAALFLLVLILEPVIVWQTKANPTGSDSLGSSAMIGQAAEVIQDLAPLGMVRIHGELWKASTNEGDVIKAGERVTVESINGLQLVVKRNRG